MKKITLQKFAYLILILLGLFSVQTSLYAQVSSFNEIKNITLTNQDDIKVINNTISDLKENYKLLYDGAKNQNDELSNQISFASYFLGLISFLFTIAGIFLGVYISKQYEKIREMKEIVEKTKNAIDESSDKLYLKLKREETLNLLKRLEEVPEDISNLSILLLSRDLEQEDFSKIKKAYLEVKNDNISNYDGISRYVTLILQHFTYIALKDEQIKSDVVDGVVLANIQNMFKRDVMVFVEDILKYIKEFGYSDEQNKLLVSNLFYFYSFSKFKEDNTLSVYIKNLLTKYGLRNNEFMEVALGQWNSSEEYKAWLVPIFT